MKVLVACEFSGIVRDAFIRHGHDAISCDLIDTENPGPHHIGTVLPLAYSGNFELMVAHPPCTYLSVSGNRYYAHRPDLYIPAYEFVLALANAPIPKIAIENPVGRLSRLWRKPDQYIQPWQFGHDASKKTGLWLKGLPRLQPTNVIIKERYSNQTPSGQNKLGPSPTRQADRARTYEGIAEAMSTQWG